MDRIESTKKRQYEAEENCAALEDELKEREVTLNVLREELKELHVWRTLLTIFKRIDY